ncbi:hypothetical protein D7Y13_16840 [Corallococcus praedator]|uniref:Outer membrane protein beta-barrel domain-containing protein n=2 Tax=Myxococcaceae TaxID=31 RepID=A0ABX9QHQ9_9BACT|nr:hypothetical protein D7X75_25045 [Corallococcus sp. CA031C]RKI07986.1 hypothetical protein D7Y13_16840 [Corallococcus praedator]
MFACKEAFMNPLRASVVAGIVALVSTGCTTTLYKSNQVSAPLLREQGEFKGSITPSNVQLAWSPRAGVGLLANGYYESYEEGRRDANGLLAEVGGGLYGRFLENAVWEAYGGVGYGRSTASDQLDAGGGAFRDVGFTARGVRAFVQPNLGYVTPYFEVGGSLRMSAVKYLSLDVEGYTESERAREFLGEDQVTDPVWLFAEPALTAKVGYKWVKAFVQHTWTLKLGGDALPHEEDTTVVGLSVDVASWYHDFRWSPRTSSARD